jgi:hypothetical protein
MSAGHSEMHEALAVTFLALPAWTNRPEVSFSIYGERGVIDVLAWHEAQRALLMIELKTELVDVNDLMATADRRRRLAPRIAREQGWDPKTVGVWIVVARSSSNARRIARHRLVLRTAFPADGADMARWLRQPDTRIAALSTVSIAQHRNAWRVVRPRKRSADPERAPARA